MILHLRLQIAKLRREQFGHGAERQIRLIEQLEMQLEDLETDLDQDRARTDGAVAKTTVAAFERRRPTRKPFPEHLPRERVVIEAPTSCSCCGSARIVKMGEDITDTLEVIPRQWKVIQTVREKFPGLRPFSPQSIHWMLCRFADRRSPCRDCEKISQPPAPFHPTPRGWAGPNLLAMVLFESEPWFAIGSRTMASGQHQPLNRQVDRYEKEGVEISLSTLADQVGACAMALQPIHDLIRIHVLGAERLHADDTTVPLMAKGGTQTARLWTYLRDDRPFAGGAPTAALYYFSADRRMELHGARLAVHSREQIVARVLSGKTAAEVAAAFAVSIRTVRKWLARYRAGGVAALSNRASAPARVAGRLTGATVALIVHLRRTLRMTGAATAARLGLARSTVARWLGREGLGRLAQIDPPEPVRRHQRERPGELIHPDIKKRGRFGPAPVSFRSSESDTRHRGDRTWQRYTATSSSGIRFR
jgi:transposase